MLYKKMNEQLKSAMRSKDYKTANSLRAFKSKIGEYLVQERLPRDIVSDEIVILVLTAHGKSLSKAIEQLAAGGERAAGLIAEYEEEIKICKEYLPDESQVVAQLDSIITQAIVDLNVKDEKQVGRIIGHVMKNNSGLDGKLVRELVLQKLRS